MQTISGLFLIGIYALSLSISSVSQKPCLGIPTDGIFLCLMLSSHGQKDKLSQAGTSGDVK